MSAVAESPSSLAVASRTEQSVTVLTVEGILDVSNTAALSDTIIKAILEEPEAVVVDVSALQVHSEAGWSALMGARWQLDPEPDVPLVLVCSQRATRDAGLQHRLNRSCKFVK